MGIKVSLFIDPDFEQIDKAVLLGANAIELHTGAYAQRWLDGDKNQIKHELMRIQKAVAYAKNLGILTNAGHGLTLDNVAPIAQIDGIHELNIGHSIIADSVFVGLTTAVNNMRQAFSDKVPMMDN